MRSRTSSASAPLSATVTSAWPRSRSAVIAKMLRKSSSTTRILAPSTAIGFSPISRESVGRGATGTMASSEARRRRPASARSRWRRHRCSARARRHSTLRGDGDDRERREPLDRPDRADGLVAVHDRHHDVHQDDVDVRHPLEGRERFGAALGDDDVGMAPFEERRHREDVAEVVVDDEDLRARRSGRRSSPFGSRVGASTRVRSTDDRGDRRRRAGRRLGAGVGWPGRPAVPTVA